MGFVVVHVSSQLAKPLLTRDVIGRPVVAARPAGGETTPSSNKLHAAAIHQNRHLPCLFLYTSTRNSFV